ncbi:DUF1549 and DUF1553 domain-containing protein [Blastopirellula marina]|uniref:BIG2 domain-containing protein n=1 Tax=Blastopirellula marina DSM 3645 TaxID=314230 RepID=A3ZN90_9BACT|nr:DUF1549 and DUF1553 domain-containing protein [Blastopirellula marina]EAQ81782.1 hypothetical protein DSM3645_16560 [Blastopirellula marina DSM 3645]
MPAFLTDAGSTESNKEFSMTHRLLAPWGMLIVAWFCCFAVTGANGADLPTLDQRFADEAIDEVPNFQRHVIPLMSRLGCNGRSCHGSFQGRGGFQLSLFGYDFQADHDAMTKGDEPRVNVDAIDESMIIAKPTDEFTHEGGERYKLGSWEHRVFKNWISAGAKFDKDEVAKLDRLEVTPAEVLFGVDPEQVQLKAVAVWADGTREDVTPLCRYTTNDGEIAAVDGDGVISAGEKGDTHVIVAYDKAVISVPVLRPLTDLVGSKYPEVSATTKIDELVVGKLRKLGIMPSPVAADEEFLRRVNLDIAGTLPTPDEVRAFVADKDPHKRQAKIDELLDTTAYVAKWTTLLCDITGNNDQQLNNVSPVRLGPSQEWYDWIYRRVEQNMPYDELATGIIMARSREPGDSYRDYCEEMSDLYRKNESFADRDTLTHYWARLNFRTPEDRAIGFAYTFMGIRIQCAQCHKHPFDVWSKQDFDDFKTFFAQARFTRQPRRNDASFEEYTALMKELDVTGKNGGEVRRNIAKKLQQGSTVPFPEVELLPTAAVFRQPNRGKRNKNMPKPDMLANILGETEVDLSKVEDIREPLMKWLGSDTNPYFAKAIVNRVWAAYFNVGIVDPADDLSLGNPPSNGPLLDYLAAGFIENGYDMKWLHREITSSDTYQRTWLPNDTNRMDFRNFSRAIPRRLPAEVAYDIVTQATTNDKTLENYAATLEDRAMSIPGTSPQGKSRNAQYALQVFGRSTRESNCECDRSMEASLLQTVYLQNDSEVLKRLTDNGGWVAELSKQINGNPDVDKQLERRVEQGRELINNGQKKLARLRQSNAKPEAIRQGAKKLAAARSRLETLERQLRRQKLPAAEKSTPTDIHSLVEEAYLRTLSRWPDEEEKSLAQRHFQEVGDPVDSIRDLMWALVNTKEFIVNH